MWTFVIAFVVIFGIVMGAREGIQYAQAGHAVEDARFVGLAAGMLFAVIAGIVIGILYALAWCAWAYVTWAATS